jgi:hypothetical protein
MPSGIAARALALEPTGVFATALTVANDGKWPYWTSEWND